MSQGQLEQELQFWENLYNVVAQARPEGQSIAVVELSSIQAALNDLDTHRLEQGMGVSATKVQHGVMTLQAHAQKGENVLYTKTLNTLIDDIARGSDVQKHIAVDDRLHLLEKVSVKIATIEKKLYGSLVDAFEAEQALSSMDSTSSASEETRSSPLSSRQIVLDLQYSVSSLQDRLQDEQSWIMQLYQGRASPQQTERLLSTIYQAFDHATVDASQRVVFQAEDQKAIEQASGRLDKKQQKILNHLIGAVNATRNAAINSRISQAANNDRSSPLQDEDSDITWEDTQSPRDDDEKPRANSPPIQMASHRARHTQKENEKPLEPDKSQDNKIKRGFRGLIAAIKGDPKHHSTPGADSSSKSNHVSEPTSKFKGKK